MASVLLLDGYQLPDMPWTDRAEWCGVVGSMERTLGGNPVIDVQALPSESGRSMTFGGDNAWLYWGDYEDAASGYTRLGCRTLQEWSGEPNRTFTLSHYGTLYTVRFRFWDQPVLDYKSVHAGGNIANPSDTTRFRLLSLKLAVA